jgi:hypothetical protein
MNLIVENNIQTKIHTIRGVQVMLDRDLADFYNVKSIRLREQVKRNPDRFPEDFIFQLSDHEVEILVSQNAIPSKRSFGGNNPFVFTEQGVAALSGVLKSDKSAAVSVAIFRAFVQLRKTINAHEHLLGRIIELEEKQVQFDKNMLDVLNALERKAIQPEKGIFFDGQLFDAYLFVIDLIKSARKSIVLIDNYVDENTLLILSKRNKKCNATIYTAKTNQRLTLDLNKHNEQYPPIELKYLKSSHDRFLILDHERLYHFGASIKDLGKKWFAFSRIDEFLPHILTKLSSNENE